MKVHPTPLRLASLLLPLACAGAPVLAADPAPAPAPAPAAAPAEHLTDAHGNALRRAPTGHLSNYDEDKVGTYVLPDPLILENGQPVSDAATWFNLRRPEILELYRKFIYGRIPDSAPAAHFEVTSTDRNGMDGTAIIEQVAGHFGPGPAGPTVHLVLYLPAHATGPVPVLLHMNFFGNPALPGGPAPVIPAALVAAQQASAPAGARRRPVIAEAGPIADILARGYGYASFRYSEIEPDVAWGAPGRAIGVRALALAPGQTKPAPDEWGTVSAWAWGASRVLDYLQTNPAVDGQRVALIGHSRLGKTVIWAGARDPRFAIVYSSCAGELGTSLARRDYGETVDDMAANFPWQFAGNLQRFPAHWNDLPVDTHMVIALNAPHPVFIGGGTTDQWADPHGEFLAEVAAGPVYRLVGKSDLGATEMHVDTPLITGDLGFHYHTGGHTITPSDWKAFLAFTDKYFQPKP
jgi:hypothetical protein